MADVRVPTGGSPTFPRSAARVREVFSVVRVRAVSGEIVMAELEDPLLTGKEVAARLGITPAGWRSTVSAGYAPAADDPGDMSVPVNRRSPRWRVSSVDKFVQERASAKWRKRQ